MGADLSEKGWSDTLMTDFDVGVSVFASYLVKRLDSDYFEEG